MRPVEPADPVAPGVEVEAVRALARVSRLLERASGELSLSQYRVLAAVASGHERASRVAARLALGKPTVSATVDSLCQRDLLTRTTDEGDQRAAALAVTPRGHAALASVEAEMVRRLGELTAHAPDPEVLLEALARLGPAVDAMLAERDAARR